VELVELDAAASRVVGTLDQVATWRGVSQGVLPLKNETWSMKRSLDLAATRIDTLNLSLPAASQGSVFFTTTGASGAVDPVLEVLELVTNARLAGADDCPEGMPDWILVYLDGVPARLHGDVRCVDLDGTAMKCPNIRATANACLSLDIPDDTPRRLVFHAAANDAEGAVGASAWRRTYRMQPGFRPLITYRQVYGQDEVSAGGAFVRMLTLTTAQERLEVLAPSPERCERLDPSRSGDCLPSAAGMSAYLMAAHDTIAGQRAHGNGLAGGARLGGIPAGARGPLFLVGASDAPGAAGRRFGLAVVLNDAGAALERDQDGLGERLEADLGTDPDEPDTDGDGLWDGFEVLGLRGAGLYPDQALPTWGADPLHKDVFVENDRYCKNDGTCAPALSPGRVRLSNEIALTCPGEYDHLSNPDLEPGFTIHVDNGIHDPSTSLHGDWGGSGLLSSPGEDFLIPTTQWCQDEHFSPIRRGIFKYAASTPDTRSSAWVQDACLRFGAGYDHKFIHELGHSLGLSHSGQDEPGSHYNRKPHHVSLMNYAYETGSPDSDRPEGDPLRDWTPGRLRFSRGENRLARTADGSLVPLALDPAALDEGFALRDVTTRLTTGTAVSASQNDLHGGPSWHRTRGLSVGGEARFQVDWDRDGTFGGAVRAEVLGYHDPFKKHAVYPGEFLVAGPQLAGTAAGLYVFWASENTSEIRYRVIQESAGCFTTLEDLDAPYCGVVAEDASIQVGVGARLDSEMSAAVLERGGQELLFLAYADVNRWLCILQAEPGSGPPATGFRAPVCRPLGLRGPPETVAYQGKLLVFYPVERDAAGMFLIRAAIIDPADPGGPAWEERIVLVRKDGEDEPLRSKQTPGFSVDPGDGSLVGLSVDVFDQLDLVIGSPDLSTGEPILLVAQESDQTWLSRPRGGEQRLFSHHRPAVLAERTTGGQPRYTLWAYRADMTNPEGIQVPGRLYQRLATSREGDGCPSGGPDCWTAFTRFEEVVGHFPESTWQQRYLFSSEVRNASLAIYRGRPRVAAAFDAWAGQAPGFVLFPLGGGIFHAALRDVDDCAVLRDRLRFSLNRPSSAWFFHGMPETDRAALEAENRVRLTAGSRPGMFPPCGEITPWMREQFEYDFQE